MNIEQKEEIKKILELIAEKNNGGVTVYAEKICEDVKEKLLKLGYSITSENQNTKIFW